MHDIAKQSSCFNWTVKLCCILIVTHGTPEPPPSTKLCVEVNTDLKGVSKSN